MQNVSFEVRSGEIVGMAGLMGAGRTEVARALFGAQPKTAGEITLNDVRLEIKRAGGRHSRRLGLIDRRSPADRPLPGLALLSGT